MSHHNRTSYDQWSSFYDQYPNPTVAIDELNFPKVWQHVSDKDVLEIGCGTGRHTQKLLAQGNRVVGIDLSPGMLSVARTKVPDAQLIEGDFMTHKGLRTFDAVVASLVIEHLPDLQAFMLKVSQHLRPGGEAFFSELHPRRTAAGTAAHFKSGDAEIKLESHAHTEDQFLAACAAACLKVTLKQDILGDPLASINPAWERYRGVKMIQIWRLEKA